MEDRLLDNRTSNPNDRKYSPTGNPLTAFVNLHQTPQERRDKYVFCRTAGVDAGWSRAMRDWRWTKIFLFMDNLEKYPIRQLPG